MQKPKRKRRTKAEMERDRAKEAAAQAEKDFKVPQNTQKYYDKPPKSDTPIVISKKYPTPKPLPKYEERTGDVVATILEMKGGCKYALSKKGHLLIWSTMSKDWRILYDVRYNDANTIYNSLKASKEKNLNNIEPKRKRKTNGKSHNLRKRQLQLV